MTCLHAIACAAFMFTTPYEGCTSDDVISFSILNFVDVSQYHASTQEDMCNAQNDLKHHHKYHSHGYGQLLQSNTAHQVQLQGTTTAPSWTTMVTALSPTGVAHQQLKQHYHHPQLQLVTSNSTTVLYYYSGISTDIWQTLVLLSSQAHPSFFGDPQVLLGCSAPYSTPHSRHDWWCHRLWTGRSKAQYFHDIVVAIAQLSLKVSAGTLALVMHPQRTSFVLGGSEQLGKG